MFDQAVRRGRLAHAYLFVGPAGVGKRLFADELAKALLCENAPALSARNDKSQTPRLEACDRCPSCILVEAGTHPDLFRAGRPEEKHELPIDVMRELCANFGLKSARGHGKVGIVDDADDLNEESANCFLKTLEEPPPRSVLILIGTDPGLQRSTIVSRCQVIRFSPLPENLIAELLRAQGMADAATVERLARLSGGSLGQARALAEPELWEFRRQLLDIFNPRTDSLALAKNWVQFVEDAGKETSAHRRRAAVALRLLIDFLRDAICFSVGATPRLAEPDDLRGLQELVKRVETEQLVELLERCLEGDLQIDRRVQLVLVLEALVDALHQRLRSPGAGVAAR
jgi:DNA polymerase-3 subunit delta'